MIDLISLTEVANWMILSPWRALGVGMLIMIGFMVLVQYMAWSG